MERVVHRAQPAESVSQLTRLGLSRPILVDATPAETSDLLEQSLARGFDLVLANKVPLSGEQQRVDRLNEVARIGGRSILHEATVGAGHGARCYRPPPARQARRQLIPERRRHKIKDPR